MNHMKWHKISAIVMAVSGVICLYSGHKMIAPKKRTQEAIED